MGSSFDGHRRLLQSWPNHSDAWRSPLPRPTAQEESHMHAYPFSSSHVVVETDPVYVVARESGNAAASGVGEQC